MDSRQKTDTLTPSQGQAVAARGNVLVMAGAGTGKTKTLVARCLDCLERDQASLDELLIVTFTEAAAAEMRERLRLELEKKFIADPDNEHWPRQLALFDVAHIGTLHSFCLRLVREHFHELGLDPQVAILDEGEARQRAAETLDEQFKEHYAAEDAFSLAVQNLIRTHGGGRDDRIRALVLRLHHYSQTRPDAAGWLDDQLQTFQTAKSTDWLEWFHAGVNDWRADWLPVLENLKPVNAKAAELLDIFGKLRPDTSRSELASFLEQVLATDSKDGYPKGKKVAFRKPLENLFEEAAFLDSLAAPQNGMDPLLEDWDWVRNSMETLVQLAQEFAKKFAARKRDDGVMDFHDLEQFALRLLWNFSTNQPTPIAEMWRKKLRFVFVDEYQDINAAQDCIITALSRDGGDANRFLVGDVKQSIYRFRLADPAIFREYASFWNESGGKVIPLSENFRSQKGILDFVNSVFSLLMRAEIGGVAYDDQAKLHAGSPADSTGGPRVELLLRRKTKPGEVSGDTPDELAEVEDSALEARLVAAEVKRLITSGCQIREKDKFRPATYGDFAVLLRSPKNKADIYAREFERASVPLTVVRGGFFQSAEILDLLSLLRLLDNPLQDVPCIAVLRSPLVALTLDELAQVRLAVTDKHFWTALVRAQETGSGSDSPLQHKISAFLEKFSDWRTLARQASLSDCLEKILADTLYAEWLRTRPRGAQRLANLERFLNLATQFDQFQRQGLFRFLKFIEAQEEAGAEPDVPAVATENAVRLMSIHQSKGLEFPVVILPELSKSFNEQDLNGEIIFDEQFGLCPRVKPPSSGRTYPSLPHWLAQRHQKRELRGEELRLLYVAFTRARDHLILTATITEKKWKSAWSLAEPVTPHKIATARSFADWLSLWFAQNINPGDVGNGETPLLRWRFIQDETLVSDASSPAAETEKRPIDLDIPTADHLQKMLSREYPNEAATGRKAKASVTELRRAAEELDDEAGQIFQPQTHFKRRPATGLSAAETGTAHHKFLQHFNLGSTDIAAEAARLLREQFLTKEEHAILDLPALITFWESDLGTRIRTHASTVQRELPFTARFSPAEIMAITGGLADKSLGDEFVVVQGVADLIVLLPKEIWLVDFKTDDVRPRDLAGKVATYRPQLQLYAAALEKIYSRKVTLRALYFLTAHKIEKI